MQHAPPPQPPQSRRPQVFAPVTALSKIKHHSEGLVLRYGEDVKVRERMVRDLHAECMSLAEIAHQAMQDPRMTPPQKEQARLDVEALKATLHLALQALAVNKQYIEDAVQTEFMIQSISQRWVAGLPPDFSILGPVTPPAPPAQAEPEPEPELEPIRTSLSSSLANPNWPEPPANAPNSPNGHIPSLTTEASPRPVAPHRVMPMPRVPAIAPQRPQPQAQQTQTQTDPLPPDASVDDHPRTAS